MIILSLLIILVSSCITKERCAKYYPPQITRTDTVKMSVKEILRDTVLKISSDSSWIKALLECDKNGKVVLKEYLDYKSGKTAGIPRVFIHDNVLQADCKCDSAKIHAILKDRETKVNHSSTETITPPAIEVKYIPGWMWFFGISGMFLWGCAIVSLIIWLLKSKLKLFL